MSNLAQLPPLLSSVKSGSPRQSTVVLSTATMSPQPANNGPHNSKLANKVDPRVDSSKQKGKFFSAVSHIIFKGKERLINTTDHWGSSKLGDARNYGKGSPEGTTGPHSSNIANKLDPRIDSDRDNRAHHEAIAQ